MYNTGMYYSRGAIQQTSVFSPEWYMYMFLLHYSHAWFVQFWLICIDTWNPYLDAYRCDVANGACPSGCEPRYRGNVCKKVIMLQNSHVKYGKFKHVAGFSMVWNLTEEESAKITFASFMALLHFVVNKKGRLLKIRILNITLTSTFKVKGYFFMFIAETNCLHQVLFSLWIFTFYIATFQ